MSLLRSGSHQPPSYIPLYTGLQIQTSSNAVSITIVYGTNRTSPNVIWTGGFFAIPQYSTASGGKGGGGNQLTGYNYYTSLAMGVCEGPIAGYRSNFMGQGHNTHLSGTSLGFATYGTTPQPAWGFLYANFPSQALSQ